MSQNTISRHAPFPRLLSWPLELDVELCATGGCVVTAAQLRSLAALLNDSEDVSLATAEAREQSNLVRLCLTVEAHDPYDALDSACALVRDRVSRAGLGPAVLVAARAGSREPPTGRSQRGVAWSS